MDMDNSADIGCENRGWDRQKKAKGEKFRQL